MDETRFLSVVHSNRIRSNGLKLEQRKFHTNMLNNFFMVRVREHWNRLPGEVMESPVEILMTCLSAYLCDLLWCTCFSRGLEPMISSQPLQFHEKLSCLLAWLCGLGSSKLLNGLSQSESHSLISPLESWLLPALGPLHDRSHKIFQRNLTRFLQNVISTSLLYWKGLSC